MHRWCMDCVNDMVTTEHPIKTYLVYSDRSLYQRTQSIYCTRLGLQQQMRINRVSATINRGIKLQLETQPIVLMRHIPAMNNNWSSWLCIFCRLKYHIMELYQCSTSFRDSLVRPGGVVELSNCAFRLLWLQNRIVDDNSLIPIQLVCT